MKKKVFVVMMAMVLALSGCGSKTAEAGETNTAEAVDVSDEASVDDAEERKAACLAEAEYGDILDPTWEGEPLAPNFIMNDYLSGKQEYIDQYYTVEEDGWVRAMAYLGDTHIRERRYYPKAICNADWTVEKLVESYNERTLPWTRQRSAGCDYLYSSDYRNCFEVCDDWLLVDDIKVCPIGYETVGTDPLEVLYAYQHGWWDGTTPIFSCDYGTVINLNEWDGTLKYRYETVNYSKTYDTMQLAYEPYLDPPTCLVTGVDEEFEIRYQDDYDYDGENRSGKVFEAEVMAYVDLPNGSMEGFDDLLHWRYAGPEEGMYVVMPNRVELYRRGVLMKTWECEISTIDAWAGQIDCYDNGVFAGETHVLTSDTTIVRLLPDGSVETVLDGLTRAIYGIGEYDLLNLSLKDGKVTGYSSRCGVVDIADDIASIDYAWNIALMTGNDGLCYAFEVDDYMAMEKQADVSVAADKPVDSSITVHCLGGESWEHYLELYLAGLLEFSEKEA